MTTTFYRRGRRGPQSGGEGTGKMAKVFVVGRLGQVEKWAVLLGFWGKMAKKAKRAKHF